MARKPRPPKSVIDELSNRWLGKEGVVAIFDDLRDGELVIVVLLAGRAEPPAIPSNLHGYKIRIERSQGFTAEKQ